MSKIEYLKDAEDAIAEAEKFGNRAWITMGNKHAAMVGVLEQRIQSIARRAELDSQLAQIRERIAHSMTFDLREASELLDAIYDGIKRQHGPMPDVSVPMGDAAQALHEAYEVAQEPADLFESMGMEKPQFPTLRAA